MIQTTLPSPSQLLGHSRFPSWYEGQDAVFSAMMTWIGSDRRFLCAGIPTGSGKSLLSVLTSSLSGRRAVILTATKGLQAQLLRDFAQIGMEDIRGQNNYQCYVTPDVTVDEGPCHAGMRCDAKSTYCSYYSQLSQARTSQLVVTNYSYYLAQTQFADGLGPVRLLVMDEAHLAFKAIESHLNTYLAREDVESAGIRMPRAGYQTWDEWKKWAFSVSIRAKEYEGHLKAQILEARDSGSPPPASVLRAVRRASALVSKLETLFSGLGRWVWEHRHSGFNFVPVWPGLYAQALYQNSEKVLLMSAIMVPKTADSLMVPEDERYWIDAPSYYPPRNTPVQHIISNPPLRVDRRATEADMRRWVAKIDQIIDRRLDRKGIMFPVSYERRNFFMSNTRHLDICYAHDRDDIVEQVQRFRDAPAPALLISPSVTSGWDFPGAECEYILIGKIPFADSRNPVVKARAEDDPEWAGFEAAQTLIQEAGRGTRSAEDKCEVFIVDDNWGWFYQKNRHYAPQWFIDRVLRRTDIIPNPMV